MDVKIHGIDIKISDDLDSYTRNKLDRLDRYLPNINRVRVDLAVKKTHRGADLAIAQITLYHSRGAILRAEEKLQIENRDSIRVAINKAVDKLYRQIDRFKGKRKSKRTWDKYSATVEELDLAEELPEIEEIPDAEQYNLLTKPEIFRRKEVQMIPMHEGEAIEQMELLDHAFYMFMNSETNQVNVLYRRENGGYGVLVPTP